MSMSLLEQHEFNKLYDKVDKLQQEIVQINATNVQILIEFKQLTESLSKKKTKGQ